MLETTSVILIFIGNVSRRETQRWFLRERIKRRVAWFLVVGNRQSLFGASATSKSVVPIQGNFSPRSSQASRGPSSWTRMREKPEPKPAKGILYLTMTRTLRSARRRPVSPPRRSRGTSAKGNRDGDSELSTETKRAERDRRGEENRSLRV